ncbi:UDP-2,4-diacetamido-2,4,6-trideoxy-beta-L-altropyranose hydrolase [Pectobacterium brasiliense]|uniref:UDP-2,4-diacetamido-2,4, 6-trideoxy-beta-L-altropyranose hydrolase n=1 Tax=Pectobacterium brasiliense TaxID=180957 RepID=A0AAE3BDI1_9GAMM|nr:UDP-2,4-diacetamido-2,4,6-trideoxy-beta-L-altropyranose hydrolase [Pectobacterium brasiliense]MBN3050256.1 UDP-2,4-diacetamido-2,4,6-trideoxy-beta-L-altropyranose hydrolase [Pectobacterium brasiliense]
MAKYLFRADASINIGSGHIMRCITLANALHHCGHDIHFICRDLPGHLGSILEKNKIEYSLLGVPNNVGDNIQEITYTHSSWLTVSQRIDFLQSESIIEHYQPDWIVVDHYALSIIWQKYARKYSSKICVIDDLADREHDADILIDQSFGRKTDDYCNLVPSTCKVLIGPKYAILRPEFQYWRRISLQRRPQIEKIRYILVSLGGVDKDNITEMILSALANSNSLEKNTYITVVMGKTAPHLHRVIMRANQMPYQTCILYDVDNMAELMAKSDLAIGAAGSTSLERCCLGLPTILVILADNQKYIANNLRNLGAAIVTEKNEVQIEKHLSTLNPEGLFKMSEKSQQLVDGLGIKKIISNFY